MSTPSYGPGVRWLAARTGRDPQEIVGSPESAVAALKDALREAADLASRATSDDPEERAAAEEEMAKLREQLADGPRPGDMALGKVAEGLRDLAERLRRPDGGRQS
jgi:hypothetical protein